MKTILYTDSYTFNPAAKTITFTENIPLEYFAVITNITDNIIIYNFACEGFGGSVIGKVLTLDYNTGSMSSTDELHILLYDIDGESDKKTTDLLTLIRDHLEVQDEILEELRICSKYLRKIYNPE